MGHSLPLPIDADCSIESELLKRIGGSIVHFEQ